MTGAMKRTNGAALVLAVVVLACRGAPATPPPDLQPSFGDLKIGAQFFTVGRRAALAFPAATGGDQPLTYTLTPDVAGMTLDPDTRLWIGTPTVQVIRQTMTYRATDADGDTALLTFEVSVLHARSEPPECPRWPPTVVWPPPDKCIGPLPPPECPQPPTVVWPRDECVDRVPLSP